MKNKQISKVMAAFTILLLAACATGPRVTTDYDSSFSFAGVERIAFEPFKAEGDGVLLSDMQKNRLRDMMATELTARGYTIVDRTETPDLLLNWHLVTSERSDVRAYVATPGYYCWYCGPWMSTQVVSSNHTEGTHIVDMIDPVKKEGVWRSVVSSPLSIHASPERMDKRLRMIAQALLKNFPARGRPVAPAATI